MKAGNIRGKKEESGNRREYRSGAEEKKLGQKGKNTGAGRKRKQK